MPEWYIRIFLHMLFSSPSFAETVITLHNTTNLMQCEGKTINFSYPFELKKYKRLKWTFSAHSTTTDIAKSKDFATGPIEYLADGYEGRLEAFPDSTIKFSLHKISRKDNGTFSFVIIHGNGNEDIFSWNLKVEAVTNITTPSVTTNIVSGNDCTEYFCTTEQKDVHMAWIYQVDKQIHGSTLRLCNNNRSRAVSCIVRAACSSNYTTVIEDVENDDLALEIYIVIGIFVGILIAMCIVFFSCYFLPKKTKEKIINLRRPPGHQQKTKEGLMDDPRK